MYNLIVGATTGTLPADRLLEVVEDGLQPFVGTSQLPQTERLITLPTLLMPEIGDAYSTQCAQIGSIAGLYRSGRDYRFHFVPSPTIPAVPSASIQATTRLLHIGDWDLSRTRWSVKNADLYQVLIDSNIIGMPRPSVFSLPIIQPEPDSLAVMMPFGVGFDPVWNALHAAASASGWTCRRADNIWEDSVVINDVVSLIARAKVVICDLTGKNANVFYEAGIAHTLGREVVLITQSESDIPFDLRHHRYVRYLANNEGLSTLQATLIPRLQLLRARRTD